MKDTYRLSDGLAEDMLVSAPQDIRVRFSSEIARVLECHLPSGMITFTLDAGPSGGGSICLEHHPATWPRDSNYDAAFEAARQYLLSCGYEVEIYGE
jgi:hypothetical protein